MITIQKGVPLPPTQEVVAKSRYPWDLMQVGDSFLVPLEEGKTARQLMQRISPAASRHAARTGRKYALRIVEDGVRIWRVEDPVPPPQVPLPARNPDHLEYTPNRRL